MVEQYTSDAGLAADRIFDLGVLQETGAVWVATENGISIFESSAMPSPSGVSQVKAFLNPFLKKHQLLVIGGVVSCGTVAA